MAKRSGWARTRSGVPIAARLGLSARWPNGVNVAFTKAPFTRAGQVQDPMAGWRDLDAMSEAMDASKAAAVTARWMASSRPGFLARVIIADTWLERPALRLAEVENPGSTTPW